MQPATFSSNISYDLSVLAQNISQAPKADSSEQALGYKESLLAIHEMTLPLFELIKGQAEKAGFEGVELFEAWPKGHCQNFVFAVLDSNSATVTDVILAKNKKFGFLQNGGGKTLGGEDIRGSAFREAQEEFSFNGTQEQMKYITIETESGMPAFHFVKGVHIGFVTPEQAETLKLSDDMKKNEIVKMPIEEFLNVTANDKKPVDHGFDRKWIAKYLAAVNNGERPQFFSTRDEVSDTDRELAQKADAWMKTVSVNLQEIAFLKKTIVDFTQQMMIGGSADGEWKTSSNRDAVKKSAQSVVDAIVNRILPQWTYESKGAQKVACQVKVQAAQGVLVNGEPLPSFMTLPQLAAKQSRLSPKIPVTLCMESFKQAVNGHALDIEATIMLKI